MTWYVDNGYIYIYNHIFLPFFSTSYYCHILYDMNFYLINSILAISQFYFKKIIKNKLIFLSYSFFDIRQKKVSYLSFKSMTVQMWSALINSTTPCFSPWVNFNLEIHPKWEFYVKDPIPISQTIVGMSHLVFCF